MAANAEDYLTPENAFANLAVLEIKFEKYAAALRYAEKGLLLNRRFAPLYNLKGMALENLNDLAQAPRITTRRWPCSPVLTPLT